MFSRVKFLFFIAFAVVMLLSVRVFHLMIFSGNELRSKADNNRFFSRAVFAPRGIVFDRNGKELTTNIATYSELLGDPFAVHPKISPIDEHTALKYLIQKPESVELIQERYYPYKDVLSHVLGYVGYVSQGDSNTFLNEKVGRSGFERLFQSQLAGRRGLQKFEMNSKGRLERLVDQEDPISGLDLKTTIDADLSVKAYELLRGKMGAIILSEVETGKVLVLVSSPGFDPINIRAALSDAQKPLLNRAVSAYPPGSVFKMITALSALKQGVIKNDTLIRDDGQLTVGEATFRNWYFSSYGKTEGDIDVVKALARSNDVFFYKAAQLSGPENIAALASMFHFGMKTGIELPSEQTGLIPTPNWKEQVIGEKWFLGDTYHMGIGQGDVLVTPLQVNAMTATLARRGIWCQPTFMSSNQNCEDLAISKSDLETVISGMSNACSPGGTAFPFFSYNESATDEMKVACKTGTAEHGAKDEKGNRQTHAWFTMFYPKIKSKVAITVLLESSGDTKFLEGSADAAPIAKSIWEDWLRVQ